MGISVHRQTFFEVSSLEMGSGLVNNWGLLLTLEIFSPPERQRLILRVSSLTVVHISILDWMRKGICLVCQV